MGLVWQAAPFETASAGPTRPPPLPYLPGAVGHAGAWTGAWAGAGFGAGVGSGVASLRCASSLATSAGKAGGEPSSSTSVTVLPMVNQSLIWSTVSLRSMVAACRRRRLNCPTERRELATAGTRRRRDAARTHVRPRPAPGPPIRARQCATGPAPRARPFGSSACPPPRRDLAPAGSGLRAAERRQPPCPLSPPPWSHRSATLSTPPPSVWGQGVR